MAFHVDPTARASFVTAVQLWIARLLKGERLRASQISAGGPSSRHKAARKLLYMHALKRFGSDRGPTVQYEAGDVTILQELATNFDGFYYGEFDAVMAAQRNGQAAAAAAAEVVPSNGASASDAPSKKTFNFTPMHFDATKLEDEPQPVDEALEMMAQRMLAFLAVLERIDARLGRLESEWGLPPLNEGGPQ